MDWRNFETKQSGAAHVLDGRRTIEARYDMGNVTAARRPTFHRYFIRVVMVDGSIIVGQNEHSFRSALFSLDRKLRDMGLTLLAVGLDERFIESDRTRNSGFGCWPTIKHPIHMMARPTAAHQCGSAQIGEDAVVEVLIHETVAGMFRRDA